MVFDHAIFLHRSAFQCYNHLFAIRQTQMVIKYPKISDSRSQFSLVNNFNFANSGIYNPTYALNASEWNVRFANGLALDSNNIVYSDTCSGVAHKVPFNAAKDTAIYIHACYSDWFVAGSSDRNGIDTYYDDSNNQFIIITALYTGTLCKILIINRMSS